MGYPRRTLMSLPGAIQIHYFSLNQQDRVGRIFGGGESFTVKVEAQDRDPERQDRWRLDGKRWVLT